jgi:hypothetical protein
MTDESKFTFTIKVRRSEITIPFKVFVGIIGGFLLLGFVKAARGL